MGRLIRFIFISLVFVMTLLPAQALEPSWEYRFPTMNTVNELFISCDNTVVIGGDTVYFLSPDGVKFWGGFGSERIIITKDNNMSIFSEGPNIKTVNLEGALLWEDTTESPIVNIAASENGSIIVALDLIGNTVVWNGNGSRIKTYRSNYPQRGYAVLISPDGEQIIGVTSAKIFSVGKYIWNINQNTPKWFFPITDITVNPRGDTIVMAGGKWLYLWEGNEGKIVNKNQLLWNRDIISGDQLSLAISDDGSTIAVGSDNNKLYVVDRQGVLCWTNTTGYWVRSVAVTSGGDYILAGSFDRHLYIFDKQGNSLVTFSADQPVRSIALSPDESLLVIATDEAVIGFKDWKADLLSKTETGQDTEQESIDKEEPIARDEPPSTQASVSFIIPLIAISVLGLIIGALQRER